MRISDWSSDVCSSDLHHPVAALAVDRGEDRPPGGAGGLAVVAGAVFAPDPVGPAVVGRRRVGHRVEERERGRGRVNRRGPGQESTRSEEHTSELQSLMRISYAVFCLNKKISTQTTNSIDNPYLRPTFCINETCNCLVTRRSRASSE